MAKKNNTYYGTGRRKGAVAKVMKEQYPVEMVEKAVIGMLPHTRLGRQMAKKLFVYTGSEHPHAAQKPVKVEMR